MYKGLPMFLVKQTLTIFGIEIVEIQYTARCVHCVHCLYIHKEIFIYISFYIHKNDGVK